MSDYWADKQVLVTGAAGFLGSHLTDRLLAEGAQVTGVDNFICGSQENLKAALTNDRFKLIEADASEEPASYLGQNPTFNCIYHLASPASPPIYQHNPVATYKVNGFGTHYLVDLAQSLGARFLFTSTSEAYGEPLEHPQKETYFGNVNPVGIRACYDESKRFGEMVVTTYVRKYQTDARVVRIFNTYGPRLNPVDGRVIINFVTQALTGKPITVYGDGTQTRSFCFVSDLIEYLIRAMAKDNLAGEVINIGNPDEHTVLQLAQLVKQITGDISEIIFQDRPADDPTRRKPDIGKAIKLLEYQPQVTLTEGLTLTINSLKPTLP